MTPLRYDLHDAAQVCADSRINLGAELAVHPGRPGVGVAGAVGLQIDIGHHIGLVLIGANHAQGAEAVQ